MRPAVGARRRGVVLRRPLSVSKPASSRQCRARRHGAAGNYSIGRGGIISAVFTAVDAIGRTDRERRHRYSSGRSTASLGRARARKSHRDDLPQDRHRRARDARADLPEEGRARADALARERADDLRAPGRARSSSSTARRSPSAKARCCTSRPGVAHQAEALDDTFVSSTSSARSGRTGWTRPTTTSGDKETRHAGSSSRRRRRWSVSGSSRSTTG